MWLEPVGTWNSIITGRRSAEGLFIRAEDALRLIAEAPATDWCGSEGGTAHRHDESDFERRERIADDRKLDRQHDDSR